MISDPLTSAYMSLRKSLRSLAGKITGDDQAADDALQDAFVRLWERNDQITSERHAKGLLVSTVRNLSIDHLRQKKITVDPESASAEINSTFENNDDSTYDAYNSAMLIINNVLSPREKEVMILRERDGWEFDDLAARFDTTPENIRVIVSRARKAIREKLKNNKRR